MNAEARLARAVTALLAILVVCGAAATLIGYQRVSIFHLDQLSRTIIFKIRLPRIALAALVGGTLAAVGAALQALFRNPLAEPFTLGVSGGATLGAGLAIALGLASSLAGTPVIFVCAFAGALASTAIVYSIARSGLTFGPGALLLAGIVVNLIAGAATIGLQYEVDATKASQIMRWAAGSLDTVGFHLPLQVLCFLIPGWIALLLLSRRLHLIAVDEEVAAAMGVNVARTERLVYLASSLLVGVTVAAGGSIGFVGLIVPHLVRSFIGQDTRIVIPASLLAGASFLILADTLARTAFGQNELPVGAVTALLGGPFFLILIRRQHRNTIW